MRLVASLGIRQAVLPPLRRPDIGFLRNLGFDGTDSQVIEKAWKHSPELVASCFSASSMWTANSATVSPSADCGDRKVHLTPANLSSGLHRSIEAADTWRMFSFLFRDDAFVVHPPLPGGCALSDEGAANHTRLAPAHERPGIGIFVFGQSVLDRSRPRPALFPARQTLEASQAVARHHRLDPDATLFVQQSPEAIDAGVFHNDVIAVGNESVLLCHEQAFVGGQATIDSIRDAYRRKSGSVLHVHQVSVKDLSLAHCVESYLFNSQLLTRPDGNMTLLCPADVEAMPNALRCARAIIEAANPVDDLRFLDLRQSMNNGGGPACLRLRVALSESELSCVHQGVLFDESLCARLSGWVERHYRDELAADDLRDPQLLVETANAFAELAMILEMPGDLFHL